MDKRINCANLIKKNKKGFTLIELIVVVLILAVIAGVAVPKITVAMDEAKEAKLVEDLRSIRIAAMTAAAEDPYLGTKNPSPNQYPSKKAATDAIAEVLGMPVESVPGYSQLFYIPGIEIPSATRWYFQVANKGTDQNPDFRLYLDAENVSMAEGEKIGAAIGLGKPTFTDDIPFNENFHWNTTRGKGKTHATLRILLHVY